MEMRVLTGREKNLALMVAIVFMLGGWWYQARSLSRKQAVLEGDVLTMEDRIRQAGPTINELRAAVEAGRAGQPGQPGQPVKSLVKQNVATMSLLEDLTLPPETQNLRVVSVTRTDGGVFSMTVEGQFAEIMRYLSFLERAESRFSVGNIGLVRLDDTDRAPGQAGGGGRPRQLRGSIQISMKG